VSDPVRVVVAEGPSSRKGLLRFVLEGEGYDVVGEAATSAELARSVTLHRPDVVVMDDGIGAMAVGMIREIVPSARVILVWPGAVVPIGGDARVEPSEVLRELGRTMERLTGQQSATSITDALGRPDQTERGHADAATLREILARGEAAQLQRAHPSRSGGITALPGEAIIEDREPAPVVILPLTPSVDDRTDVATVREADAPADAGVVVVPDAEDGPATAALVAGVAVGSVMGDAATIDEEAEGAGTEAPPGDGDPEANEFNRKLGTIALGGAAAAGALVLALALGGSRVPVVEVRGEAPVVDEANAPVTIDPVVPTDPAAPTLVEGATGAWVGDGGRPFGNGGLTPTGAGGTGTSAPGGGTSGTGGGGGGGGGSGTGGSGTGGSGTGGGGSVDTGLPGQSAAHNPHGGPPGQTGVFPGQGNGGNHQGPGNGHGAHAVTHRHGHKR